MVEVMTQLWKVKLNHLLVVESNLIALVVIRMLNWMSWNQKLQNLLMKNQKNSINQKVITTKLRM